MFLQGTIYAVIFQNNSNLWGKMVADVEMDADFDATSLNVFLMLLCVAICTLIGQFTTSTKEAQEDDVRRSRLSPWLVWQVRNVIISGPVWVYDKAAHLKAYRLASDRECMCTSLCEQDRLRSLLRWVRVYHTDSLGNGA